MEEPEIDPALSSGDAVDKEISVQQEKTNQAVSKIGKSFKLTVINTDQNQDKGVAEEKEIQLFIKNRRSRWTAVPSRAEQAGQGHGGDKQQSIVVDEHREELMPILMR